MKYILPLIFLLTGCDTPNLDSCGVLKNDAYAGIPFITTSNIRPGFDVSDGEAMYGCANTKSGKLVWQLIDSDGEILSKGIISTRKNKSDTFDFVLRYNTEAYDGKYGAIIRISEISSTENDPLEIKIPVFISGS
jgi:hypothetical protein